MAAARLRWKAARDAERAGELSSLVELAVKGVDRIVMVLGPPNSGKSTVLKQFRSIWEAEKDVKAPLDFHGTVSTGGNLLKDVEEGLKKVRDDASPADDVPPVVIIDAAEYLVKGSPAEGKRVVNCFRAIASEKKATVIMATYDDSLREDWIGADVHVVYVGYFGEVQARAFLCKELAAQQKGWWRWLFPPSVTDEQWKKIYNICGGCPLLLTDAAKALTVNPASLEESLRGIVDSVSMNIIGGVSSTEWPPSNFNQLMELMTSSEDGRVEWDLACEIVFGGDDCQLKAMQAKEVIHVQLAPSRQGSGFVKFIMPLSPPLLEAMRQSLAGGESD